MTDYAAQRSAMVETQLRTNDITDRRIVSAMFSVPRERFLPEALQPFAYLDRDLILTTGNGSHPARFIMEPVAFAKLLMLAGIGPDDRILDIGSATGYSAAILSRLGAHVTALECDPALSTVAEKTFAELEITNTTFVTGPLSERIVDSPSFDVILIEGAVEVVPESILGQLSEGGRLVAIVGSGRAARATLFERLPDGIVSRPDFDRAVAPLPGFSKPQAFMF